MSKLRIKILELKEELDRVRECLREVNIKRQEEREIIRKLKKQIWSDTDIVKNAIDVLQRTQMMLNEEEE